ncbi:MAG: phage tail assembly chaperone [Beijerinckiaceae bacterium]
MGIIEGVERKVQKGPECPLIFAGVFEKYRELKFIQRETGDNITVYPREMINWTDIIAYKAATGQVISMLEADLIMRIDAIFEGRHDG